MFGGDDSNAAECILI